MKKLLIVGAVVGLMLVTQVSKADPHRLGLGVRYYINSIVNQIYEDASDGEIDGISLDDSGLSWVASYQYRGWKLVGLEADLEFVPEDAFVDGGESIIYPQIYVLVGSGIYAAAGIGVPITDAEGHADLVYNLRVGFDIDVIEDMLHLDLNANYGFSDFDQLSEFSMDYITAGLSVRYEF